MLVGIKMSMALVAGSVSQLITAKWLVRVNWLLGVALLVYAILFALKGISLFQGEPLDASGH
jgi:hypothetical protein